MGVDDLFTSFSQAGVVETRRPRVAVGAITFQYTDPEGGKTVRELYLNGPLGGGNGCD